MKNRLSALRPRCATCSRCSSHDERSLMEAMARSGRDALIRTKSAIVAGSLGGIMGTIVHAVFCPQHVTNSASGANEGGEHMMTDSPHTMN